MIAKVKFKGKTYQISCYGKAMGEYISSFLLKGQFYEEPLLTYLYDNYKFKNVVDVGANIGNHSAFFSKVMGAKVTSFEPVGDNFRHLIKNNPTGANFNVGIGDKKKEMAYFGGENALGFENKGAIALIDGKGVKINTLDSYSLKPDLIKIDVEGMEPNVIQGGIETIKKYKPVLVIEHNDIQKLYDTSRLLVPLGYIIKPFVEKDWEIFIYEAHGHCDTNL